MATKKKKIINDATIIASDFLQPIFGGNPSFPITDPNNSGHQHNGGDTWGSVSKIDLTNHTTGRLVLSDAYAVAKSVSAYPSIIATPNDVIAGTVLNIPNSNLITNVAMSIPALGAMGGDNILIGGAPSLISGNIGTLGGAIPLDDNSNINGGFSGNLNLEIKDIGTTKNTSPFTVPDIVSTVIWYFTIPFDMDTTKPAYFSFGWMGDILTVDGYGNSILDPTKAVNGIPQMQTSIFRVTWQWYMPGFSIFPPAVVYDGYAPSNIPGTNILQNSLTRGRIASLVVNDLPFKLIINDSSINTPSYISLTGLQATTGVAMLGVQVDVLSTGFVNNILGSQTGHLKFFSGTLVYLSKIIGSQNIVFKTL